MAADEPTRYLRRSGAIGTVAAGLVLGVHVLQNYSFMRMGGTSRFVVDTTTLALVVAVVAAQALPAVRRLGIGDAVIEFDLEEARKRVAESLEPVPAAPLVSAATEERLAPVSDPPGIAAAIVADLTEVLRQLGIDAGIPSVGTKPAALLVAELERRGAISSNLAAAVLSVVRPAQTAFMTGRVSLSDARELRRLSYVLIEALQPDTQLPAT